MLAANRQHGKRWLLTYDNYDQDLESFLEDFKQRTNSSYIIACRETAPSTGMKHMHVVCILPDELYLGKKNIKFFDLNETHPNIELVKAPHKEIDYIKKGGKWKELGECPYTQPKSLKERNEEVLKKGGLKRMVDNGDISIFSLNSWARGINIYKQLTDETKNAPTRQILWYYGPTGSGKTRRAWKEALDYTNNDLEQIWVADIVNEFFNGYAGQKVVIFDDYRSGELRFNKLLQITDRYRISVNIKGGSMFWNAELIIFTAPVAPQDMFIDKETHQQWDGYDQLIRRITEENILEFPQNAITEPMSPISEIVENL